jgi:deoxyinosine 3'endonuclease (endonuclease V)
MQKKTKYEEYISQIDPELLKKWKEEQDSLKSQLIETDELSFSVKNPDEGGKLKRIAGMDISASKTNPDVAITALVVCDFETFEVLYEKYEFVTLTQPYVPGFLAFREVEHLVKLLKELENERPELAPQMILSDGNGILHSNRFGIACHLGVLTGYPTCGCGKTVFSVDGITKHGVKDGAKSLKNAGEYLYLQGLSGAVWGAALKCTEKSTDPLIVSQGHKITLDTALDVVKKCTKYRVPEPVRIADKRSRALIKEFEKTRKVFDIEEYLGKIKQNVYEDSADEMEKKKKKKDANLIIDN